MRIATFVIIKKTGQEGHVFYLTAPIDPARIYQVRRKGTDGGCYGTSMKGSEFTIKN